MGIGAPGAPFMLALGLFGPSFLFPPALLLFGGLTVGIYVVILGAIAQLLFSRQLLVVESYLQHKALPSFGWGCLILVAVTIVAPLMALTIVLLPLSFVASGAVALIAVFGWAAVFSVLGRRMVMAANWSGGPWLAFGAGALVVLVLSAIPAVNVLVGLVGGSVGIGAVLLSRFGTVVSPGQSASEPMESDHDKGADQGSR